MTKVVDVPAHLDDQSFDQFAKGFAQPAGERLLFDAHATQWSSPYGLVGLLAAGQWLQEQQHPKPLFAIPREREVAHYWARTGFFGHAAEFFELHGKIPYVAATGSTDVLLEVTPVRGADDVHAVVDRIQDRAADILRELGLERCVATGESAMRNVS